jgi:hypothetical protein
VLRANPVEVISNLADAASDTLCFCALRSRAALAPPTWSGL